MWRKLRASIVLASLLILAFPGVSHADVNDFTITNFQADYYLSHDDPQGALDIDEHIDVNFTDYNHGILRAIPERYNGENLHVSIAYVQLDGATTKYSTSTSNGN